jgi:hypothetical protein
MNLCLVVELFPPPSIAERINELTHIPLFTILHNLDVKFKQEQEKVAVPATLGVGERVRIPEPLVHDVQVAVEELKKTVEEKPERKEGDAPTFGLGKPARLDFSLGKLCNRPDGERFF